MTLVIESVSYVWYGVEYTADGWIADVDQPVSPVNANWSVYSEFRPYNTHTGGRDRLSRPVYGSVVVFPSLMYKDLSDPEERYARMVNEMNDPTMQLRELIVNVNVRTYSKGQRYDHFFDIVNGLPYTINVRVQGNAAGSVTLEPNQKCTVYPCSLAKQWWTQLRGRYANQFCLSIPEDMD